METQVATMPVQKVSGDAFHLPGNDIDTDRIIPARYLVCLTFDGLGKHVFNDDRAQKNGQHPFDLPENRGCTILIADNNFGCGSSREHAVAALQDWGIKAIIARSFAEIFRGNATANGIVCVDMEEDVHAQLLQWIKGGVSAFHIDLTRMLVRADYMWGGSQPMPITMPSAHRDMFLEGTWEPTTTLLGAGPLIEATAAGLPYMW